MDGQQDNMKYLKLKAYSDGSISITQNDLMFYIENDAAQIEVDFTDAGVSGLRKWIDFEMSDTTTTTRPLLVDFTTADILTVTIDNYITKAGQLKLQPFANDPVTLERANFDIVKLLVQPALNVVNDTAYVDPNPLQAILTDHEVRITALEDEPMATFMHLDGSNSNIDELHFDITPTSTDALTEGQLRWNATDKTLDIGMDGDGIVQQVGMETYYPTCINDDSVTIPDGSLVMFSGSVGNSGLIKVKRVSTTMPLPALGMGIATESIAVGTNGRITWFGLVRGVQTNGANYGETWVDGTVLYNSGTITGGLSMVKPIAPKSAMIAGIVVNANPSNGILFARPTFFPFLGQLSDVAITTPLSNDVLTYNSSALRWENSSQSANFKITPDGGYAIKLTNKTGVASVKGTVVMVGATDNSFKVNIVDSDMPIGVVYDSGIADGSECFIVVSGMAYVLLVNSTATTRGYVAYSSGTTAGRVDTVAAIPAADKHFREIGHTLESKTGGTNVLVKCIIHFN